MRSSLILHYQLQPTMIHQMVLDNIFEEIINQNINTPYQQIKSSSVKLTLDSWNSKCI